MAQCFTCRTPYSIICNLHVIRHDILFYFIKWVPSFSHILIYIRCMFNLINSIILTILKYTSPIFIKIFVEYCKIVILAPHLLTQILICICLSGSCKLLNNKILLMLRQYTHKL